MKRNWTMREYQKGDEKRILEYQNKTMAPTDIRSSDYWKWEYQDNPIGIKTIWVAEDGDLLVGHYALMPLMMKVGTFTCLAAQSVDTFTHHEYRRLGIFVALAEKVYSLAAAKGISALYGFPSIAAYHGFVKKLDWIKVTSMDKMIKPLTLYSFIISSIRALLKNGPTQLHRLIKNKIFSWKRERELWHIYSSISVEQISSFDHQADELWSKIDKQQEIRIVKDSKYLNWRYIHKPNEPYSIFKVGHNNETLGYLVFQKRIDRGRLLNKCLLVDIISETNPQTISLLLLIGSRIARSLKGDSITNWTSRGSFLNILLLGLGYSSIGELILIARQNRREFDKRILHDVRKWFLMAGDTDIV